MSDKGEWRGHEIELRLIGRGDLWVYSDTGDLVSRNPNRDCGFCDLPNTPEGHDGCLGTLPSPVMNACCGHGRRGDAYVQFEDGSDLRGDSARRWQLQRANPYENAAEMRRFFHDLLLYGKDVAWALHRERSGKGQ